MELLEKIVAEALALGWKDWTVTITALVYVVLAARENAWCWPFGIVSCGLWAYASFADYSLYLDALLQLFYVGMGFWGWYWWKAGKTSGAQAPILRWSFRQHLPWLIAGTGLAFVFGYFFDVYTPAAATYLDAVTTVFAMLATWLLTRKVLENWLYWIVVDAAYIYLYATRGAWLFSAVMVIYTGIAVMAYFGWRKRLFQAGA